MATSMQRVMICGGPGSGKSWLAREVGRRTGLPVFHMDHIHWKPGWVERTPEEKLALVRSVQAQDRWVFEGGHSTTYSERLARADSFVWLDMSLALRFWRVFFRTLRSWGRSRPDLPEGCPENFGPGKRELFHYMWRTRATGRAKLAAIFANPPRHLAMWHLRSRADVACFLERLP